MKHFLGLAYMIGESMLISLLLAPIIASLVPVHLFRIMSRTFLVMVVYLLVANRSKLGINTFADIGLKINKKWFLLFSIGLIAGILTMGIISLYMLHFSIRFAVSVPYHLFLWKICGYIITGLVVGLVEEIIFRGFILRAMLKDTKFWMAIFITSFLYSIVHFFKPINYPPIENLTIWTGFIYLKEFFKPIIFQFPEIISQFIGLFLVGIVLALACLYSNSLGLPIGLHMGWIIGIKTLSLLTDVEKRGNVFFTGKVIENVSTWIILMVFALFFWLKWTKCPKEKSTLG